MMTTRAWALIGLIAIVGVFTVIPTLVIRDIQRPYKGWYCRKEWVDQLRVHRWVVRRSAYHGMPVPPFRTDSEEVARFVTDYMNGADLSKYKRSVRLDGVGQEVSDSLEAWEMK